MTYIIFVGTTADPRAHERRVLVSWFSPANKMRVTLISYNAHCTIWYTLYTITRIYFIKNTVRLLEHACTNTIFMCHPIPARRGTNHNIIFMTFPYYAFIFRYAASCTARKCSRCNTYMHSIYIYIYIMAGVSAILVKSSVLSSYSICIYVCVFTNSIYYVRVLLYYARVCMCLV